MDNPATRYCCGPNDCERLPKASVRPTVSGYVFGDGEDAVVIPYAQVLPSIDDDFWVCRPPDGKIRCFFAPPLGV